GSELSRRPWSRPPSWSAPRGPSRTGSMQRIQDGDLRMERRSHQRPGLVEALALIPAARGEDGLRTGLAPAHAAVLEPLGHERLAGSLDHAGADHEALLFEGRVVHPSTVAPEVAQGLANLGPARVLGGQVLQRADDLVDAPLLIPERFVQGLK